MITNKCTLRAIFKSHLHAAIRFGAKFDNFVEKDPYCHGDFGWKSITQPHASRISSQTQVLGQIWNWNVIDIYSKIVIGFSVQLELSSGIIDLQQWICKLDIYRVSFYWK